MIKSISFENFRNLTGKYNFTQKTSVVFGKNSSGKSNLLDGIVVALSTIVGDYCKINKSDFANSDDSVPITIKVEIEDDSIPSLQYFDESKTPKYDFIVIIKKTSNGRYTREIRHGNGSKVDTEILYADPKLPKIHKIPLLRIEEIYNDGLTADLSTILESEEEYASAIKDAKNKAKEQIADKVDFFKRFCEKFDQKLDIQLSDPKIQNEKIFITDGELEHNKHIGSGYKSIANIVLNTLNDSFNIVLIDEIENHIHPSMIRTLLSQLESLNHVKIIATSHSPIVLNQVGIDNIVDINRNNLTQISNDSKQKLARLLCTEKTELFFAEKAILVEGYTEKLLLSNYAKQHNYNWTVINAAGVMFEPYLELAKCLKTKIIAISDNDKSKSESLEESARFKKLREYCANNSVTLLETENTLESDLVINSILDPNNSALTKAEHGNYLVVKEGRSKTELIYNLLKDKIDISKWHIIRKLENEFESR